MGLFDKIKKGVGIGVLDLDLTCEVSLPRNGGVLNGQVLLTPKSDIHIIEFNIKLVEHETYEQDDRRRTRHHDHAVVNIGRNFDLAEGDIRQVQFQLPYSLPSTLSMFGADDGLLGTVAKAASFLSERRSEFYVEAECDVKDVAFDPDTKRRVTFY